MEVGSAAAGRAETPVISRDGRYLAFWHSGDLVPGQNADGSFELFRVDLGAGGGGGAIQQLTTGLAPNPYHSAPSISDDGSRIAFVLEADLAGTNADGSWELFLWEAGAFRQLTDWQPAMGVGRTLLFPSISGDGRTVVFAGEGYVDASLPGPVVDEEVFRWRAGVAGIEQLTTATGKGDSSFLARVSRDGRRVVFFSLSNFSGTNDNDNVELFAWDEGGVISQVSEGQGRWNFSTIDPELAFGLGGSSGTFAAFVSEKIDDPTPLMRTSPRGFLFYNPEAGPGPAQPPAATATPAASATPETPSVQGNACPQIIRYVPRAVIDAALANPSSVDGWMQPSNPALPPGFNNPPRIWLSLRDLGKPFGPFNGVVWKPWCP
jgi:Tol biopolymer transport system component